MFRSCRVLRLGADPGQRGLRGQRALGALVLTATIRQSYPEGSPPRGIFGPLGDYYPRSLSLSLSTLVFSLRRPPGARPLPWVRSSCFWVSGKAPNPRSRLQCFSNGGVYRLLGNPAWLRTRGATRKDPGARDSRSATSEAPPVRLLFGGLRS